MTTARAATGTRITSSDAGPLFRHVRDRAQWLDVAGSVYALDRSHLACSRWAAALVAADVIALSLAAERACSAPAEGGEVSARDYLRGFLRGNRVDIERGERWLNGQACR
jgi:hypothetical protein